MKNFNLNVNNVSIGIKTAGGQPGQQIQLIDTIRRQEVETVLNNQNIILNTANEIKSFLYKVYSKTDTILNNQAHAPTAQVFICILYLINHSVIYFNKKLFYRYSKWETIITPLFRKCEKDIIL